MFIVHFDLMQCTYQIIDLFHKILYLYIQLYIGIYFYEIIKGFIDME